jgi:hypothetical protein
MTLSNIAQVLLYGTNSSGDPLTLEQLTDKYGFEPDGTNYYYGFTAQNVSTLKSTGRALNTKHQQVLDGLLTSVKASKKSEKTLNLGLEPTQDSDPYRFVASNIHLARQLAIELKILRDEAESAGKCLHIVVRYGSEMNDLSQAQGKNAQGYRSTFPLVREAFRQIDPGILFSFSPAIRADLPESAIAQYWPGDEYVDIVGGTWYINGVDERNASMSNLRAYVLHRTGFGRPFALSEVGGCAEVRVKNDAMLEQMLDEMNSLGAQGVAFKYATIFLSSFWGSDAQLAFLDSSSTPNLA